MSGEQLGFADLYNAPPKPRRAHKPTAAEQAHTGAHRPAPRVRGSDTSEAAAESVGPVTGRLRRQIYALICERGGLTCDEVEALTGLAHQTASARIYELKKRGQIVDCGERRPTRSGRKAAVYVPR